MHSHLIVATFEGEEEASRVYDALQQMRDRSRLGLDNAAAVIRDGLGRLSIYQKTELAPDGKDHDLISTAIALLFGELSDERRQELTKRGVDERFRQQVAQDLASSTSAVLFLVTADSQVDRGRLLGILNLFQGRVYETTLPLGVETALVEVWEA